MSPHCPTEIMLYPNKPNEQTTIDIPQSHYLSGNPPISPGVQTLTEQIQEGSFYEIDHSKLPPRTPSLLLQSIRVVMVTVKTAECLTVRYPSTKSIEEYFMDPTQYLYPKMDDKFIMGPQLAAEVLVRRVPSPEFTRNICLKSFWIVETSRADMPPVPLTVCNSVKDEQSKFGTCLFRLQSSNMTSWGERRLVSYAKNVKNSSDGQGSSHSSRAMVVKSEMEEDGEASGEAENSKERIQGSSLNDGQQVSSTAHVEAEEIKMEVEGDEVSTIFLRPRKRTRRSLVKSKIIKTADLANMKKGIKSRATKKQDPDSYRWSSQRYESAKQELFAVMKARDATCSNPISRHALRAEARKQIGDTGLLDHLLKHVVDTLAPGGNERFKRRWDSQGAMEYWLESADLDDIRKEAGVQDPYWTPPPGWNLGDPICNHSSDCAALVSGLKEELARMRGEMQVMAAQKHEQTLAKFSVLSSVGSIESLNPAMFKERYNDLLKEKATRELELLEISKLLNKMESSMKKRNLEGLDG